MVGPYKFLLCMVRKGSSRCDDVCSPLSPGLRSLRMVERNILVALSRCVLGNADRRQSFDFQSVRWQEPRKPLGAMRFQFWSNLE
jgi:hypothetical protein